jgi:DnaD/phage-associated family protein
LHYAEKMAFSLYDAGICTSAELTAEFEKRDRVHNISNKIRSLFGLGDRAFTTKEKKLIASWVNDMGYGADIIEKAYEVAADATGKGSIPYANSVLERWNSEGLRTLEDIERSYQKDESVLDGGSSFDTDSFFAAAVRRALGDD